jgi:hypothetical protein
VKVLFFMRSAVYARNFESTLRALARRGHDVHVVAPRHDVIDPGNLLGRLCSEYRHVRHTPDFARPVDGWSLLGEEVRRARDYLRYRGPDYRDAPKLRRRAEQWAPSFVLAALRRPLVDTWAGRRLLGSVLDWCDQAIPRQGAIDAFLRAERPDLVLVTPLVEPGSPQSEFLRSARALGIRTGLCVYSWDNLTNKGLIHDPLDVVTVWNDTMKQEAVRLHRVPADRVVITGAAPYDQWFDWKPAQSREPFCARVGLDPRRPFLLYLCSSRFIAPNELPFVRRWIDEVRAHSRELQETGVLVRPHPQNTDAWQHADLSHLPNVAIWPRTGGNPADSESRAEYYDSMYHSAAVVGVNTSAQIESAIVGRGVYTVLAPEFQETQEGTLHFRHLRRVNGGLLNVATDMAEHAAQLESAIRNPCQDANRRQRFIEAFVRPYGLGEAATPRLVAALEAVAARGPARRAHEPWWASVARPSLARAADTLHRRYEGRARRRARKASRHQRQPVTDPGVDAARAFAHYECVREHVRRMGADRGALADAEEQIVAALAPLWDASPQDIADLRQFAKGITGVRRSQYRGPRADTLRVHMERDLLSVVDQTDSRVWTSEPLALGGFGFTANGKRYNEDTLRYVRVLALLDDAALLREFHESRPRQTVWEVGGGWGGLAYQFKSACPNVTYLITGVPDLFLLSATYLMTMFPSANFRFYDDTRPESFWSDWDAVDFAFAPERVVASMKAPTIHLAVDVGALERMTPSRIDLHVRRAHALGCRYFASFCPTGDPHTPETGPVLPTFERFYWLHALCAPAYLAKRLALGDEQRATKRGKNQHTYALGWRRLHA